MPTIKLLAITTVSFATLFSVANARTNIIYFAVAVDDHTWGNNPAGTLIAENAVEGITTLEIKSAGGNFIPDNKAPGVFLPPFDTLTTEKLFVLKTDGFNLINFGNVVTPGLSDEELLADMSVSGSLKEGGGLAGDGPGPSEGLDAHWIPEPTSSTLIGFGLLGLLGFRRKR